MSTYSLTLRSQILRRLSISEMDNNFLYLQQLALSGTTSQTGISFEEDTYDNWMTKIDNGELQTGSFIKINDYEQGLITLCTGTNSVSTEGLCGFLNPDYQKIGDYSGVEGFDTEINENRGVWNVGLESRIINYTKDGIGIVVLADPSASYFSPGDEVYIVDELNTTLNNVDILHVTDAYHITCNISVDTIAGTGSKYLKNITNPASILIDSIDPELSIFNAGDTLYSDNGSEFYIESAGGNISVHTTVKGGTFSEITYLYDNNGLYVKFTDITDADLLLNDVIIWNQTHYQVVDIEMFNGTDPEYNPQAYMILETLESNGYILEWDQVTFDYSNGIDLIYRKDKRGNDVYMSSNTFQWGDYRVNGCKIEGGCQINNNDGYITVNCSKAASFSIDTNSGEIFGNLSGFESGFEVANNTGVLSFDITGSFNGFNLYDNDGFVRIKIDGRNSGATIDTNSADVNLFINGVNDDVNLYGNEGPIDAHVHGYNTGLYSEGQNGTVKVYIYDESYVDTSYNTAEIYATYINGSYVIHFDNAGDIYSTTFDGFGKYTSDNYFNNDPFSNKTISLLSFCSITNNIYYTPGGYLYTTLQGQGLLIPGMTYEIYDNEGPATTYGLDNSDFYNEDNTDNYVRVIARTEHEFERFGKRSWKVPTNAPVWNNELSFYYGGFDNEYELNFNTTSNNENILYNYYIGTASSKLTIRYEGTYYDYNPYTDTYGTKHRSYNSPNLIYEYVFDFYNNILEVNVESNPYPGLFEDISGVIGTSSIFFGSKIFYANSESSTKISLTDGTILGNTQTTGLTYSGMTNKNTLTLGASYSSGNDDAAIELSGDILPPGLSPSNTFYFLGATYSSIFLGTNGYLTFGEGRTTNITSYEDYNIPGVYLSTFGSDCKGSIVEWGGWIYLNYGGLWGSSNSPVFLDDNNWLLINKKYQSPFEQSIINDITGLNWDDLVNYYYRNEVSDVIYNNGVIEWLRDSNGNEIDFILLQDNYVFSTNYCIYPDLTSIDFCQYGRSFGFYGNKNQVLLNNYVDGTDTGYWENPTNVTDGTQIYANVGQLGIIDRNILTNGAQISGNTLYPFANIAGNYLVGIDAVIRLNIIESGSYITSNDLINPIMSNHIFNSIEDTDSPYQLSSIVGCTGSFTMINTTIDKSSIFEFTGSVIDTTVESSFLEYLHGSLYNCSISGLYEGNFYDSNNTWEDKVYTPNSSTFDVTIAVTASTILNLEDYNYAGIINLTSTNPTASISKILHSYSSRFEFKIEPEYELAVTFEGTPVADLDNAHEIVLPNSSIEINGTTSDYIKFEYLGNIQAVRQTDAMNYN